MTALRDSDKRAYVKEMERAGFMGDPVIANRTMNPPRPSGAELFLAFIIGVVGFAVSLVILTLAAFACRAIWRLG